MPVPRPAGKLFGRTQLTAISPKKTVEGAIGGLSASVLCALALRSLTTWPASITGAVGLGGVIFVASILGDLIESVMKRDAGIKDSGSLIPGHGGILDRFDSYIFTGAVVYFYMKCLPLLGL
jgi:phosphatidate cytidylyltransferase